MVGKNKEKKMREKVEFHYEPNFFSFLVFFQLHGLNVTEEQQTRGRLCNFHEWPFTCLCENVHLLWDEMVKLDGRTQLIHSNITFHHISSHSTSLTIS